jgi:large subunit ribosomal protein L29
MNAGELRAFNEVQLQEQLGELHGEWRDLRFEEAIGKLTATARIRQIRKEIARIHTIRTEREMDAALKTRLSATSKAS